MRHLYGTSIEECQATMLHSSERARAGTRCRPKRFVATTSHLPPTFWRNMGINLGDVVPDFKAETSDGDVQWHSYIDGTWAILFSHPGDFTPVCTTELGTAAACHLESSRCHGCTYLTQRLLNRPSREATERVLRARDQVSGAELQRHRVTQSVSAHVCGLRRGFWKLRPHNTISFSLQVDQGHRGLHTRQQSNLPDHLRSQERNCCLVRSSQPLAAIVLTLFLLRHLQWQDDLLHWLQVRHAGS